MRILLSEYMELPLSDRQSHLDLSEPCLHLGASGSRENRALLAVSLNTTCCSLGMRTGILCHACNDCRCSNVKHLYWGTAKENVWDRNQAYPDMGLRIKSILMEKYGEDYYGTVFKNTPGKPSRNRLSEQQILIRLEQLRESEINIYKHGWVSKVSKLWGVSHSQVKRFFESYWEGNPPYRRKSDT